MLIPVPGKYPWYLTMVMNFFFSQMDLIFKTKEQEGKQPAANCNDSIILLGYLRDPKISRYL